MVRQVLVRAAWFAALVAGSTQALGQQDDAGGTLRDSFEMPRPTWRQEASDAPIRLRAHERSDRAAHDGRFSERFDFTSGAGSAFYYSYPLPKIPVNEDLKVGLFVRANRVGVQLAARVILPSDADPETGQPTFVTVLGTSYTEPDRWQRLELIDLPGGVERQAQILRTATRRPLKLEGAYIERLIVNLYAGPGDSEVYLDELRIAPVPADLAIPRPASEAPTREPDAPRAEGPGRPERPDGAAEPAVRISLSRNRLRKDGQDWVFTAIDAPGAEVEALRSAGFDVLSVRTDEDAERLRRAARVGFLFMPLLEAPADANAPFDGEAALSAAEAFPERRMVAFWNLGNSLGSAPKLDDRQAELERIRSIVSALRRSQGDYSRLATGLVASDLLKFSRAPKNLDMLGIVPAGLGSVEDLLTTYKALVSRRDLTASTNAEALYWLKVPATPKADANWAIWGPDPPPAHQSPRVQPEQVRLYTYLALAAGYRGLFYQGDSNLTKPSGRELLIEMALLNEEVDLFESVIAQGRDPIEWLTAYMPEPSMFQTTNAGGLGSRRQVRQPEAPPIAWMRVASLKTQDKRGALLLVGDYDFFAQYQPPQMAYNDIFFIVPGNEAAQAFEISPGGVRALKRERVAGGLKVTLPVFDTTAMVLVTTDSELVGRLESAIASVRPRAVAMAIEQAQLRLEQVTIINGMLTDRDERKTKNDVLELGEATKLIRYTEEVIKAARQAQEDLDFPLAWSEARRANRSLRLLMGTYWLRANTEMMKALKKRRGDPPDYRLKPGQVLKEPTLFVAPVTSPPLASFNTLPQQWKWVGYIRDGYFGANLLKSGSFEDRDAFREGWKIERHEFDGVLSKYALDTKEKALSKTSLRLAVGTEEKDSINQLQPFHEFPTIAATSPPVHLDAGQFVKISLLYKTPRDIFPGSGGVIVRDSIGGEAFEFRSTIPTLRWVEVILYRRAPVDTDLTVKLGLAGFGEVYFDNLKIQPLSTPPPGGPYIDDATPFPIPDSRPRRSPEVDAAALRPLRVLR